MTRALSIKIDLAYFIQLYFEKSTHPRGDIFVYLIYAHTVYLSSLLYIKHLRHYYVSLLFPYTGDWWYTKLDKCIYVFMTNSMR